ncbi:MAG: hypothetical protein V8T10_04615 [Merdibacter sp.]
MNGIQQRPRAEIDMVLTEDAVVRQKMTGKTRKPESNFFPVLC